jgi:hypothetical protein
MPNFWGREQARRAPIMCWFAPDTLARGAALGVTVSLLVTGEAGEGGIGPAPLFAVRARFSSIGPSVFDKSEKR